MNVTLYLETNTLSESDFKDNKGYYADGEYIDAITKENENNRHIAHEFTSNMGHNIGQATAKFNTYRTVGSNDEITHMLSSEALLFNENGEDESVDKLISYCVSQDIVVSVLEFNPDSIDPEFEEELNMWFREHENIGKYSNAIGEDAIWENEPTLDFICAFKNLANEEKRVRFKNAKILERGDYYKFIILSEKIILEDGSERKG